jgi:predicted transcriptional regulator
MSLSYQHAPQNAVFELSTQVGIVRNKLCYLKKELDSSKTADALVLKTTTDNLQAEIDSIDTQLKPLKDELSYTYSLVETKNDLVTSTRRELLQIYNDKTE